MKKFFIIVFVIIFVRIAFSQEDKVRNPSIELPEFEIVGTDIITLQKGKKIDIEVIPVISEQFLKPSFTPEDLQIAELSDPVKEEFRLTDSLEYYTGKLNTEAGSYTLPGVNFYLSIPYDNGIFQITANGLNRRAHAANSEQFLFNSGVNVFYQLESQSAFFNGTKFQFHGDYGRNSYKLYAADDPFIKRDLNKGYISLNIENLLEEKFNYSLRFSNDIHSLQDNIYSENFVNIAGMFRANLTNVNLGVNSSYKVQFLRNELVSKSTKDFLSLRPFIGFSYQEFLKATFGLNYSNFNDQDKFYPYIFAGIKLNEMTSVYAEYSPETVFLGNGYFLDMNPYFYIQNFVNHVFEKKNSIQLSVKYAYEKYYEVNVGIKYFTSDALPYFESSALSGRFNVVKTSATSYNAFGNLLFHLGPYGYLYGSVELNETKSKNGNILPYYPAFNSFVSYGYNFDFGLSSQATLNLLSKQYANLNNTESLGSNVNLKLNFAYKISNEFNLTFELNNLLNQENYRWLGYREPPLDFTAGIIYRW